MKHVRITTSSAVALSLAATSLCLGQQEGATQEQEEPKTLTIGDKAPQLDVEHWIKGDGVSEFDEDKVYVVEFWATWCGPCLAGMPHISDLQDKYKDYGVRVLGISDESLDTVEKFLEREDKEGVTWNEKTRYTIATDPDQSVYKDYMVAASQNGIPTAFIVGKEGHVEWIGHPMGMDDALDAVVRDEWDRETFKAEFVEQQEASRKAMELQRKMRAAEAAEDWPTLMKMLDDAIAEEGHVGLKVQKFVTLLIPMNEPEQAYAYGREIAKENWDDPFLLNHLSWMVADSPAITERDLDFAMDLGVRASELTEHSDASILDTVARVHYEKGDLDKAIEWQRKSVDASADQPEQAESLKATLKKYEAEAEKN